MHAAILALVLAAALLIAFWPRKSVSSAAPPQDEDTQVSTQHRSAPAESPRRPRTTWM